MLTIVLPSEGLHVASPADGDQIEVRAEASEAELDKISGGLGGVLIVEESWVGNERQVESSDLSWGLERVQGSLDVRFVTPEALVVKVERYANDQIEPSIQSLAVSAEAADAGDFALITLPPASDLLADSLEFNPARVGVRGPAAVVQAIVADPSVLAFEPIDLTAYLGRGFVERLSIDREKLPEIEIDGELFLRGQLAPRETLITTLELEVALVSFDAARLEGDAPFLPPTELVQVQVMERGLFPEGLPEATRTQMLQEILQFVRENARVFVDVDRNPGGSFDAFGGSVAITANGRTLSLTLSPPPAPGWPHVPGARCPADRWARCRRRPHRRALRKSGSRGPARRFVRAACVAGAASMTPPARGSTGSRQSPQQRSAYRAACQRPPTACRQGCETAPAPLPADRHVQRLHC